MFELKYKTHFDAAHCLRGYPGKCANLHGHRWEIEVEVVGERLDQLGMLVDFNELKDWLRTITQELDHQLLNETEGFKEGELNPTAENIAWYCYQKLREIIKDRPHIQLRKVSIWEAPGACASYFE